MAARLARQTTDRPRRALNASRSSRRSPARYLPYHVGGEIALLLLCGLLGMLFLLAPFTFWIKLLASVGLFVILPSAVLRDYWPKLPWTDIGWQPPQRPSLPWLYWPVAALVALLPVGLFLAVADHSTLVAVSPRLSWLDWLIAEGFVVMYLVPPAAFFAGILLFRLSHLMPAILAVIAVAVLVGFGLLLLPGPLPYLMLPAALPMVWLAWQTKSFVPAAVAQIVLTVGFDLLVRLT